MYDKDNPVKVELASLKELSGRNLIIVIVLTGTEGNGDIHERSKVQIS